MEKTKIFFSSAAKCLDDWHRGEQVSFYFPGGGKIALFLGNFVTFLYIMQIGRAHV